MQIWETVLGFINKGKTLVSCHWQCVWAWICRRRYATQNRFLMHHVQEDLRMATGGGGGIAGQLGQGVSSLILHAPHT